jgi:hypothetical protein
MHFRFCVLGTQLAFREFTHVQTLNHQMSSSNFCGSKQHLCGTWLERLRITIARVSFLVRRCSPAPVTVAKWLSLGSVATAARRATLVR